MDCCHGCQTRSEPSTPGKTIVSIVTLCAVAPEFTAAVVASKLRREGSLLGVNRMQSATGEICPISTVVGGSKRRNQVTNNGSTNFELAATGRDYFCRARRARLVGREVDTRKWWAKHLRRRSDVFLIVSVA